MELKKESFYKWPREVRVELKQKVIERVQTHFGVPKEKIESILAVGSRIYKVKGWSEPVFREQSDLDVLVMVETEAYLQIPDAPYPMPHFTSDTLRTGFLFYGVRISCFIFPADADPSRYFTWRTPSVDIETLKVYGRYELDVLDYLIHAKDRVDPFRFCAVCMNEKDRAYLLSYTIVSGDGRLDESHMFPICEECMEKLNSYTDEECAGKYRLIHLFRDALKKRKKKKPLRGKQ